MSRCFVLRAVVVSLPRHVLLSLSVMVTSVLFHLCGPSFLVVPAVIPRHFAVLPPFTGTPLLFRCHAPSSQVGVVLFDWHLLISLVVLICRSV
jgi:hypothetical protein